MHRPTTTPATTWTVDPRIRGLIFDCDGTLVDTMPLHWRAWQTLTHRYGFTFTEAQFYALGGVPTREILRRLAREQSLPLDPQVIAREKEEAYLELLPQARPIPEIIAIAQQNQGLRPMAVATGGTHRIMDRVLGQLGIGHLFQAVVTSEDVTQPKPAPDIFLEAARRLGVAPADCLAFEDTDLGMQAIRAAGMDAVDVRILLPPAGPGQKPQ